MIRDPSTSDGEAGSYLEFIRGLQDECSSQSWKRVKDLGAKIPALLDALDVLLAYLERAATCFGGCHGGDHRAEMLVGRAVSTCQSCLLLMTTGYYDESLSLIRSLGEIANLMSLFATLPSEFTRWRNSDHSTRMREFKPVNVRIWLENHGGTVVIDKTRYAFLSSYSIHAGPDNLPQAHNEFGNAIIGPRYQEAGFVLSLNELARPMAFIGVFSVRLIGLNEQIREAAFSVSRLLIEQIGGITADVRGRPWFSLN